MALQNSTRKYFFIRYFLSYDAWKLQYADICITQGIPHESCLLCSEKDWGIMQPMKVKSNDAFIGWIIVRSYLNWIIVRIANNIDIGYTIRNAFIPKTFRSLKFYNSKTLARHVLRFLFFKFSIANYKLVKAISCIDPW